MNIRDEFIFAISYFSSVLGQISYVSTSGTKVGWNIDTDYQCDLEIIGNNLFMSIDQAVKVGPDKFYAIMGYCHESDIRTDTKENRQVSHG